MTLSMESNGAAASESLANQPADHILKILVGVTETMKYIVHPHLEIVVHDLRQPESSIVAIVNGHVSGRQLGASLLAGPLGDKAFDDMIARGPASVPNDVVVAGNYFSKARDGRTLASASTVIYDADRKPVAAFCLNADTSAGEQVLRQLRTLLLPGDPAQTTPDLQGDDETKMEDLVSEIIEQAIAAQGLEAQRLTKKEKMAAVGAMHARGLFLIRGSIERVARRLGATKFTVYNYLDELGLK